MSRVVHFDIHAEEPVRAIAFYAGVFGWEIRKYDGPEEYWLISTGADGPGIDGGLARRSGPFSGTTVTVEVPSVDEYLERITARGGIIVAPKMTIPSVGFIAYCLDLEGNLFGIIQNDPSAR